MQSSRKFITTLLKLATCAVLAIGMTAHGADKKSDPTGTWTWTQQSGGGGGGERKITLKLKLDGDKLTGTYMSAGGQNSGGETAITDAKVSGEDISFNVTREFNGNKRTTKYVGKLSGDSIKGKSESERNGEKQSRDWDAKRSEAK